MNDPTRTWERRRSTALSTGPSSRRDRVLDRAVPPGRQRRARLVVLHVLDPRGDLREDRPAWRRPRDRSAAAAERIRHDPPKRPENVEVAIEEGDPATPIEEVAASSSAGLIVTGAARNETLGRRPVGSTSARAARRTAGPQEPPASPP